MTNVVNEFQQVPDFASYPPEINGYPGLWDPHHCLATQNSALGGYPDILTAFNSDLGKYIYSQLYNL